MRPPAWIPALPRSLDQLGVPVTLIMDLAVRQINLRGVCTIHLLSDLMKLPLELAETVFRRLSEQHYLEIKGMEGDDYVFSLSATGRKLAAERSIASRYCGPLPVSLKSWAAAVRAQVPRATPYSHVTREKLRAAFWDIVVPDKLLDALGPALISQRAIFLYGPSGTGKTTISERLLRVFDDAIAVPYAVEVDGQVVILADPAVHEPVEVPQSSEESDPRWVICKRPFLAAGGELTTNMLDLQKDESTGAFNAPLQMKANNGILLIDDFGRQLMSPRDLLNRWIVPLDRRIDFLSPGSGSKFDIPFELMVVFSTNLEPHELADEAFLRRIPNKILIDAARPEDFDKIFHLSAAAAGMDCEPGSAEFLRELCLRHSPDLRPCFPRDICSALRSIMLYENRKPAIARADLERAVAGYFVSEHSHAV